MTRIPRFVRTLGVALPVAMSLALGTIDAFAQGAPKVLHLVVPFGPGGGQDVLARSFNNELGAALGMTAVVEYKAGGGGGIGSAFVAKSDPATPTLLVGASSHMIAALLPGPKPAYDPVKDFSSTAHIGTGSQVLLVSATTPAKTVGEFVAYAKANAGKLNYATAGSGSSTHLAMAYFASVAGIDIVHIPYKSNNEPVQEMLAGRIQAGFLPTIAALPLAKEPRLRILGVSTKTRSQFLPQVPAIAESGFPDYIYASWFGLLGPAGADATLVQRVNTEMNKLLASPAIAERILKLGIEPQPLSVAAFGELLRVEAERTARVIKISGAKAE